MAKKYTADTFEGGAANLTGLAVNTDDLVVSTLGNVGIGGTPTHKLYVRYDVAAASDLDPTAIKLFNNSDGGSAIEFSNGVAAKSKLSFGVEGTGGSQNETYIGFSTSVNGATPTERLRIDSSGNVGIGTSSPVSNLHIKDSTSSTDVRIQDSTGNTTLYLQSQNGLGVFGTITNNDLRFDTNDTERMRIDSSGNVGIGTSDPNNGLHVKTSTNGEGLTLQINSTTEGDYSQLSFAPSTADNATAPVYIRGVRGSNLAASYLTLNTNSSERMRISSSGNVGIGEINPTKPLTIKKDQSETAIMVQSSDTGLSGIYLGGITDSIKGGLILDNSDNSLQLRGYNNANRLHINSSGSVGIGETSPDRQLHLKSSLPAIRLEDSDVSGLYHEFFASTAGFFQFKADGGNVQSGGGYLFQVDNSEKMRIDSNGNVGIGTSSISEKLEVVGGDANGTVRISANETDSCFLTIGASTTETRIVSSSYGSFGHLTFYTGGAHRMRIQSSGNVLIGKTSAGVNTAGLELNPVGLVQATRDGNLPLLANRLNSDGTIVSIRRDNVQRGSISVSGSTTSFNTTSDYRLKENVVDMTGALDRIEQLQPKRFNFISNAETTVDGFIAHEVQSIIPEAITGEKDAVDDEGNPEYQGIDQSKIVPLLVGAIKELKAEIETLKSQIN